MLFKFISLSLISCLALQNFATPLDQCIYKNNTYVKDEGTSDEYYKFSDEKYKLIASLPEKNIKLYAIRSCDYPGLYTKFILKIKDDVRNFYIGWYSLTSPYQNPVLILSDVNNDKIDELIIISTVATGTGLRDEEIHIININPLETLDYKEYFIANPLMIIKEKVTTKITKNEDGLLVYFKINGNDYTVRKDKKFAEYFVPDSYVVFTSGVEWEVINDKIYAHADAGLMGVILGNIVIEYKYIPQSQVFNVDKIYFDKDKRPKFKSNY
ncbi:hypothetical protein [Oceanirhabdus sp. W0125-5]|uniref:hypothetical protein n=1 Tax=Oceanirhabdus sp. W0125-5 TaxID=2999116 RepID=UPI0022F2F693|nr:hypothetical protein [Oceanirhabdus sp. W0125-5]WBW95248.1 hypothetical protein OW730_16315 [Oceanirhabdus sp. W0125-5]